MAFTIRIDEDKQHKLDMLAESMDRSRNWLVNEAIDNYLNDQEYINKIRTALIVGEESGRSNYSLENLMQKLGRQ